MEIYEATETEPTSIPVSSLLINGRLNILPEVQRRSYFSIRLDGDALSVTAGDYVGLIPLNTNVAIHVRPRFPIKNMMRFVSVASSTIRTISSSRGYEPSPYSTSDLLNHLLDALLQEMKNIQKYGFQKEYRRRLENGYNPRGKILFNQATIVNSVKNVPSVSYAFHELTLDTPENRLLKYTLWYILTYAKQLRVQRNLIHDFHYFFRMLDKVPLDTPRSFLNYMGADNGRRFPTFRHFYVNMLQICLLIVNRHAVIIESQGEKVFLPSFMVNMHDTFQYYLLNLLTNKIKAVQVQDGNNNSFNKSLFDDITDHRAEPDIIIRKEKLVGLIIDAKYKGDPKREDLNQMISYCLSYNSPMGLFICPMSEGKKDRRIYEGAIDGIQLFTYYFDMENDDVSKEEEAMTSYILELVS